MMFTKQYEQAIALIDKAYQENTELVSVDGVEYPKEFLYAKRMIAALEAFQKDASEEVYLAARCQHLFRWEIPRNTYPMDRKGYHQWRTYLYTYQANKTEDILNEVAYNADSIGIIKDMIEKKNLKSSADSQLLEDVVCVVFLEFYLDDFIAQHKEDKEKLKRIIKNTWLKMSDQGHQAALKISFKEDVKSLVLEAVS